MGELLISEHNVIEEDVVIKKKMLRFFEHLKRMNLIDCLNEANVIGQVVKS